MGCGCSAPLSICRRRRRDGSDAGGHAPRCAKRKQWAEAGVESTQLIVRAISGSVLHTDEAATFDTPLAEVVAKICEESGASEDTIRLCSGPACVRKDARLGECVVPSAGEPVELLLLRLPGPPIKVESASGRPIELQQGVPSVGAACHFDRSYRFTSLGGFADRPGMQYVKTSNDDKSTPANEAMWRLEVNVSVVVYLNFRSRWHASIRGTAEWLREQGWAVSDLASTVSTGIPNGPYSGPVYSKSLDSGTLDLMGSECSEGAYFVFVEQVAA